jgi:hypothetical protein
LGRNAFGTEHAAIEPRSGATNNCQRKPSAVVAERPEMMHLLVQEPPEVPVDQRALLST